MNSIIYVGMDVHTTNYTLCCFSPDKDSVFAIAPDGMQNVLGRMDDYRATLVFPEACVFYSNSTTCVQLVRNSFSAPRRLVICAAATMGSQRFTY